MSNLPIGIVRDMPAEQYHADPSVSNSMLTTLSKSAAHCYAMHHAPDRPERTETKSMFAGTLAHCSTLESDAVSKRYIVLPEDAPRRPSSAQIGAKNPSPSSIAQMEWWGRFTAVADGRDIVTDDQYQTASRQLAAVLSVPELRRILSKGEAEVSLFWDDESTGLRCRARCDWLHWTGPNRAIAMDLKTTADITPEGVRKSIANYGYHRQHAHYCNGLRACGIEVEAFVFGFVSNGYPFLAAPYLLDDEAMEQGQQEIDELLNLYAWCKERNEWPFVDGYQIASLPNWAKRINEVEIGYAD